MLWNDKHRPLDMCDIKPNCSMLCNLARNTPNIIFNGPEGCGKRTRCFAMLRLIYGRSYSGKKEEIELKIKGKKVIQYQCSRGAFHSSLDMNTVTSNDIHILRHQFELLSNKEYYSENVSFKVLILLNCTNLSISAQNMMRKMIDNSQEFLRVYIVTERLSSIRPELISRFFSIRVPVPRKKVLIEIAKDILAVEGGCVEGGCVSYSRLENIVNRAENIRHLITLLQTNHLHTCLQKKYPQRKLVYNIESRYDFQMSVDRICHFILHRQDGDALIACRDICYKMISNCVDEKDILLHVYDTLDTTLECEDDRVRVLEIIEHWDAVLNTGSKCIFHIEACISELMLYFSSV